MNFLKKSVFAITLFYGALSFSQERETAVFGEPFPEEFTMTSYSKDPEAAGVVLFERAKNYVELIDGYVILVKEVYGKIKVFDAKRFEYATVEIPYYNEKNKSEKVTKITALTHNGTTKSYVRAEAIFDTDETPKWALKKFTFPNVNDGSILEYTYRIESTYFSNFGGWQFQGPLPKIYTELHTEIPGNFRYNRTLYGNIPLYINKAEKIKSCFSIEGFDKHADCEIATYAMKNVPAAKKEKYMLSQENYLAGMKYELIEYRDFAESNHPYTRNWDDVDDTFRYDKDLGRQLKYTNFFKKELPPSLFSAPSDLEKAKAIYYYIQNRMAWDGKYRIFSDVRVKEAYERKSGNSSEINLLLINALEAADLDAKIMLVSTRDYALPTTQYPTLSDFIYAFVYLKIGNEKYLLDATDKYTPFGVLPFRDLCAQGRVMDFKNGSYWEPIIPNPKNMHYVNMQLQTDGAGIFSGKISEVSTGYISVEKRKTIHDLNKEEIFKQKQNSNETLDLSNLEIENQEDMELPFKENYTISMHEQPVGNILYLYPFLMPTYFSENPFSKETRKYPIDFGFPVTNNYLVSIDLKDKYEVVKVPGNKLLKLPENDGELSVVYDVVGTKVNVRLNVRLNNYSYAPEAYQTLREFFSTLVKIQSEEPIELKKIQ